MNETLFKHEEKIWKPRNKQAAMIMRRASPLLLHTPPEELTHYPTRAEILEAESKIRLARIAAIEAEQNEKRERKALARAAIKVAIQPKKWKHMWAVKAAKRMAKSRGLPPPTQKQLMDIRKAQPNFGKPIQ